jgi:hypothetical protein
VKGAANERRDILSIVTDCDYVGFDGSGGDWYFYGLAAGDGRPLTQMSEL